MEPLVFIAVLGFSFVGFWRYWPMALHRLFAAVPNPGLGLTRVVVLLSVPWFTYIFLTGAASDIIGFYVAFYVLFAYAALLIGAFAFPVLGLHFRADVLERQNLAAGILLSGFAGGTMFAFGGALTGEGPGWIVVFVFFVLAYLELRAAMAMVSRIAGGLAQAVRLDREVSAAVLLAGVALGAGLISGRAAAGDFLGWSHAMSDYGRRLWPILIVPLVAALVGFITQNASRRLFVRALTALALTVFGAYFYFMT